jgi:hypothetical protein
MLYIIAVPEIQSMDFKVRNTEKARLIEAHFGIVEE